MMMSDVCLSDVCLTSAAYIRSAGGVCVDGAYWLIGPGSAGLAQGCRCALPLQAWAGHIVAAARLQLVKGMMRGKPTRGRKVQIRHDLANDDGYVAVKLAADDREEWGYRKGNQKPAK